jgi:hypothetical protein
MHDVALYGQESGCCFASVVELIGQTFRFKCSLWLKNHGLLKDKCRYSIRRLLLISCRDISGLARRFDPTTSMFPYPMPGG